MTKKIFVFITVLFLMSTLSFADEGKRKVKRTGFLFGIGFGTKTEIYKGVNQRMLPIPIIGYKGEKLSILGPFVSYNAFNVSGVKLSLKARPRFDSFDESDSYIFRGMAEREMTVEAGLGIKFVKNDWEAGISGMHDILNRSNGFEITTEFGKTFRKGPFFFKPVFGISYVDSRHVNYYYGVGQNETNEFTEVFRGKASFNPMVGLSFSTPILLGGFTRIAVKNRWYDSNISDSPLTDKVSSLEVFCTYSRFF